MTYIHTTLKVNTAKQAVRIETIFELIKKEVYIKDWPLVELDIIDNDRLRITFSHAPKNVSFLHNHIIRGFNTDEKYSYIYTFMTLENNEQISVTFIYPINGKNRCVDLDED